jgi:hypothetical protein
MRILAFITAAEPVDVILRHLGLPATPPPRSPPRGPPQHDLDFDAAPGPDIDQTPAYDLTEPEPVPDFGLRSEPRRLRPEPRPPGSTGPAAARPIQIPAVRAAVEATLPTHLAIASSPSAMAALLHTAVAPSHRR